MSFSLHNKGAVLQLCMRYWHERPLPFLKPLSLDYSNKEITRLCTHIHYQQPVEEAIRLGSFLRFFIHRMLDSHSTTLAMSTDFHPFYGQTANRLLYRYVLKDFTFKGLGRFFGSPGRTQHSHDVRCRVTQ